MRKELLQIPIDWISPDELIRKLKLFVVSNKPHQVTTVNPEFIVLSTKQPEFKEILIKSDLSLPDGAGIVIGQTFLEQTKSRSWLWRWLSYIGCGLRFMLWPHSFDYERITGVALSEQIMHLSAQEGWRVYLLGAAPGVAAQAAAIWQQRHPGLNIVGTSAANPTDHHILKEIKDCKPDVLLVAYGAPKQELFIAQHKDDLKIPIMVGVGGTFDYVVENIRLAPGWVRRLGLEWLVRLIQQPKRFKRVWHSTLTYSRLLIKNY